MESTTDRTHKRLNLADPQVWHSVFGTSRAAKSQ